MHPMKLPLLFALPFLALPAGAAPYSSIANATAGSTAAPPISPGIQAAPAKPMAASAVIPANSPIQAKASGDALLRKDPDFLAMRDAFRIGDTGQVDRLYPLFSASLLEPYVAYYYLHMHLEAADAASIKQFLSRPADTPMIDKLRGEWLKQLGKTQQWDAFTEEYPRLVNEDPELLCYALQARRRVQEQGALVEARRLWFSGEAQPEDCMPLFDAALVAGIISEDDIWQRFRLALEAVNMPLARQLAAKLASRRGISPAALDKAYSNPGRYLGSVNLAKAKEAERLLALFALRRLAKQSSQIAISRWERIAAYFPEPEQRYFYGWLGYEASRSLDNRALEWYKLAGDTALAPPQLAWRTRAALRQGDWREVLASIEAMGQDQQREKAWRYWKARALDATGAHLQAQALFEALSGEYGYYGQLSAGEMDPPPPSAPERHMPDQEVIDNVQAQPGVQRALSLYRLGLDTEASKEWAWAVRGYDDRQLLAAAEIALRNGIYDRSIDAAEHTRLLHDFNLRFPAPYRSELQEHVRSNELDEAWVYGLMRQESRFVIRANSSVGAAGLMQIMPETARWVARKIGMKNYRNALINELSTNLKLGTYYLKTVLSQLGNNPVLASAAYNAGPNRAQQWRGDKQLEGAIYIETIPFDETRDYVKKVMSNTTYYAQLFGQPQIPLKQRLGVVTPKDALSAMSNER
ncbi:MAG TPA: transglycosylase SLT domain-containing protein [Gallionellaceae bacterium]